MVLSFLNLFERHDHEGIEAIRREADLIVDGVVALLERAVKAFDATDTNDPEVLWALNTFYNYVTVGDWELWLMPHYKKSGTGGRVLASVSGHTITFHCLTRIKALMHLLQAYRFQTTDTTPEGREASRLEARKIVDGLIKKLHSPELQFILQHEIQHTFDMKSSWFVASKASQQRGEIGASDKAGREIKQKMAATNGDLTIGLRTGRTLNVTKPRDRAAYQDMLADRHRHAAYVQSSHERNANFRAASSIALARKRPWAETVKLFQKAYLTWFSLPPEMRKQAIRRLYVLFGQATP